MVPLPFSLSSKTHRRLKPNGRLTAVFTQDFSNGVHRT